MRAGWIVQASPPASTICRACLRRFGAAASQGQQLSPPPAALQHRNRRHFSNGVHSRQEASPAHQAATEASTAGPDGSAPKPKPRFGGLAGSRQATGPSVEDLEKAKFEAARQAAATEIQPRHLTTQATPGPAQVRRKRNGKAPSHRSLDLSGWKTQQKQSDSQVSTGNAPSGSAGPRISHRATPPIARDATTKDQTTTDSDVRSNSSTLPQRSRMLRQAQSERKAEPESRPQGSGWGSLRQRVRGEASTRDGDGSFARRPQGDHRSNEQSDTYNSYYAQAAQREKDTRGAGYVGFGDSNNSADDTAASPALSTTPVSQSRHDRNARRASSRFEEDEQGGQAAPARTAGRSYDATPNRRDRSQSRRALKFEDEDASGVMREMDSRPRRDKKQKRREDETRVATPIELPPFMSVQSLAIALRQRPEELVAKLEELGFEDVAMDHVLDAEDAGLVAMEYNFEPIVDRSQEEDLFAAPVPEDTSILPQRPPVITIMGHVDHGKTTILDYLRKSSIAASEHGGITQHIGAFVVPMAGRDVTFLDTPGHAAFLSMRERGANVTDIVILVVAADDSVKPQTIEAIKHAKAAKVPIIVAINKVDKDEADVNKVKQDLMVHDIEVEDFGGDYQAIEVSGKTGQGMDDLEEAMITQAELLDMRAPKDGPAEGWIIEATTKRSGRTATVLVRRGTLRIGDVIVAGKTWARVRTLRNEAGVDVAEAGPGTPVEIAGW